MDKLDKIIQIIFLVFFISIICFGLQKAYLLGEVYYIAIFAVLTLIPVLIKDPNVRNFKISLGKMIVEIFKNNIEKIIKSDKSDDDKVKGSQKLIDETFKIGYEIGSGRAINNIRNVKFTKNKDGKTTDIQFDEN
ncbi:hypothetical protein KAR28_00225 [Candidatus Parcubacteria bacterium]|nr:hypothetical protein [Candidatus Parcubacteria bacterium]